ncbi:MAG: putative Peptidase propeptide [Verrucomicrobiales bacterium]|nr:putative Peptidase propeptide [Verrucomicrobiales bacterium]
MELKPGKFREQQKPLQFARGFSLLAAFRSERVRETFHLTMNKPFVASHLRHSFGLFIGLLALMTGVAMEAGAQSIPNPSFEANTFSIFPGYASDNGGGITGWVLSDPTHIGLNPGGGSPFADNGAIPNGLNVAFVQSSGGASTLSTTITGLTSGTSYQVTFRANRRTGVNAPNPTWSLNGEAFVAFTAAPEVGGSNPYYVNTGFFIATNATAALSIRNQTADDSTLLVDDFSIVTAPSVVVTSSANSGPGSLRQTIIDNPNRKITFATNLSGAAILLTGGQLLLDKNFIIDATALPAKIQINGNGASRVFQITTNVTVVLNSLTITNGLATDGGGIYNEGNLTLNQVTMVRNSARGINGGNGGSDGGLGGNGGNGTGGGIYNTGTLTLNQSTVSQNSALGGDGGNGGDGVFSGGGAGGTGGNGSGGGIYNAGIVTLNQSTLSENSAAGRNGGSGGYHTVFCSSCNGFGGKGGNANGGSLYNAGTLTIDQVTLSGNSVVGGTGGYSYSSVRAGWGGDATGGGCFNTGNVFVKQSTVSGNSATAGSPASGGSPGNAVAGGVYQGNTGSLFNSIVANNSPNQFFGAFTITGNNFTNGSPILATLGSYGGPTATMPPLVGSPVIDAGAATPFTTDQRGFQRVVGPSPDIGAVEFFQSSVVTNNSDAGVGSLRYAATYVTNGSTITFLPNLSGSNIVLASEIVLANNLTIDGSSLPAGITVDGGPGNNRIFSVSSGNTVSLVNLTLTGGNGVGLSHSGDGGAILNLGTLRLTRCSLYGNSSLLYGGAIETYGLLSLTHCTLFGNSAQLSGAIDNFSSTVALTHCTLSGNSASVQGGALVNYLGNLTLTNTIAAGNTAPTDSDISGSFTGNNNLTSGDPLLAVLGSYGGSTKTMPPLSSSPAIDAASIIGELTTDQRGFPRVVGPSPDIGAVELELSSVVATGADSGRGSLRYAATYVNNTSTITFATNLSGSTLVLGSEIVLAKNLTIDGTGLPAGITLDGGAGNNRIFSVSSGNTISLVNLNLTGGNGAGATYGGDGGAILNLGALTLTRCTFWGNSAVTYGGAIESYGPLSLTHCTLSGNSAPTSGAIDNFSSTVALTHCTISGNSASSGGGAIANYLGTLTLVNTIAAANTAPSDPDISGPFSGNNNLTSGDPLLASLGNYGGPTKTMPLLSGSPAINAASVIGGLTTDQRGFPRVIGGAPDIGAVEGAFNSAIPLSSPTRLGNGSFQFGFANLGGLSYTVFATTNLALPIGLWSNLGPAVETPAGSGQFQFVDPQGPNRPQRFYRVKTP